MGGLFKRDFRTHSGSSEHSLDSESKFEPSVAIDIEDRLDEKLENIVTVENQ